MAGQWFSPGTPGSSTNNTDRHDITVHIVESGVTPVPDLPLCLGVVKHKAPLARGLPAKKVFYDGCLLMRCNFKFV